MAPLPALLKAAQSRGTELEKEHQEHKVGMESLETEIAAKREEKSIAAQGAVRELLKKKESLMQEGRNLVGAASIVSKAVAKLQRAIDLGLKDWMAVHTEKIKLSSFAAKKLEAEPKALQGLREACAGAELVLNVGSSGQFLQFSGDKALVPKLQAAVALVESEYETFVEIDDMDTFSLLDARDEIGSLARKHEVNISRPGVSGAPTSTTRLGGVFVGAGSSTRLGVSGTPKVADKVADLLKALMTGKEDIDCPKNLATPARHKAKEIELDTGAVIAVEQSGGWGGGGIIYIRGIEMCVDEAATAFRIWLDEREGATSDFVLIFEDSDPWTGPLFDQFRNDTGMMGSKFGIAVKQTSKAGQMELRGKPDKVAEAGVELQMILAFYRKEQAKADAEAEARAKAPAAAAPEPEEDEWGDAPAAEPLPGGW